MAKRYNSDDEYSYTGMVGSNTVPYSIEAEQSVLGTIILDPAQIGKAVARLSPEAFYIESHRDIYETMLEMYNLSRPMEELLLLDSLRNKNLFVEEQEKEYLLSLAQTASTITNIEYYIEIVEEKYSLRQVLEVCTDISKLCYTGEKAAMVLDEAERRIFNITKSRQNVDLENLRDVVKDETDRLNELATDKTGKFEPLKIGISGFDNMTGGLNNSDLVILAARPGMGKTAFALNIAYNIATSSKYTPKKSVVFFSLEMSSGQLAQRIMSTAGSIDHNKLKMGDITDDEWAWLIEFYREQLLGTKFLLTDNPLISITEMKAKIRRVDNLGLIIIDYLQLMAGKKENVVQEISDLTRSFKLMAKEFNVPILLLSQLSRAISKRDDKTPQLSDLRDSGSIEQDADLVMFIDRPEMTDPDKHRNEAFLYVQKNRHGETGKISMMWDGKHTSFKSIDTIEVPE